MSDLSNRASNTSSDTAQIDECWNINKAVENAGCVHVCVGTKNPHLNVTYFSKDGAHHVEIPNSTVKISDTKYGVVVSAK